MNYRIFFLLFLFIFSLQGCSWICKFYIANTSRETLSVEIKLMNCPGNFPIFHYPHFYYGKLRQYSLKKNGSVNYSEEMPEVKADTLENFLHFRFQIPPRSAVEIGCLHNDNYSRYDQCFINDRKFNLEQLKIMRNSDEIIIIPSTFDKYFKKGKHDDMYYIF